MKSRGRNILLQMTVGMILAIGIFMVFEGVARVLLTLRDDLSTLTNEWYTYSAELGWERRPNFTGTVTGELRHGHSARYLREFDADGFFTIDTAQRAGADQKRILAIGDSNTFGWGVPTHDSFVEVLDEMLPEAGIVNLGVSGYTSYQGRTALAKHIDTVRPNLIIASFNFNDRRAVFSSDLVDSRDKFIRDALLHRTDVIRNHLYLYRTLQAVMSSIGLASQAPLQRQTIDVRNAHVRVTPAEYRRNLEEIARLCQERHIPLVLIVLEDNPSHTAHLRAGVAYLMDGHTAQAEREFRIAINLDNWFSDTARKYLATMLEHRGAVDEAQIVATLPASAARSAHGGRPLYLDSEYNDIMRSIGRAYGATIVEAGAALATDPSLYLDLCHPDERGHRLIALLLKSAIEPLLQRPAVIAQSPQP